ncbi:hypothetical protein OUZ56_017170 [Daphnia magna]|uniref:Uncharacterized protein n=1 Tax=Daphnia magna TaxID=35525 RepID=A0ABR0ASB3_9CRUS|nr:hypothetical protein OUZ56_017170 [Daphnia magna]
MARNEKPDLQKSAPIGSRPILKIKFFVLYQHRGPERTNTAGRNSALATQHPILVYSILTMDLENFLIKMLEMSFQIIKVDDD